MHRRKANMNRGIKVEEAAAMVRPVWNDTLRGILVALVKDRKPLWDSRFRTTKERSIQLFREIAAILSNQDNRMNEWYVLEKWCWMMEMYTRAIERPHFEWRFKGAMSFHMGSPSNGIQYIDSLTPDLLAEATARYAETDAEVIESKTELSKKFRKGCAAYRLEMTICYNSSVHVTEPGSNPEIRQILNARSGALSPPVFAFNRDMYTSTEAKYDTNAESSTVQDEEPLFKEVNVKQEANENNDSNLAARMDISATAAAEPTLAFLLSSCNRKMDENVKEQPQETTSDVNWTYDIVCELIDSFKEHPALWHYAHPHYGDLFKRREYLSGITMKLRIMPGGSAINEDVLFEKWNALQDRFNEELVKAKQGEVSGWEFYQRMLFLTPEVLSACRFDDLNRGIQSPMVTNYIAKAVDANIRKILGYLPKSVQQEIETNQAKRPKVSPRTSTPKLPSRRENASHHVQQVVSTWVPPREDSIEAMMQPFPSAPPTATAQITAKNEIGHILKSELDMLRQSSPHPCINGSKYGDSVPDQSLRLHEDKWTLMGRMIEETARELEAKNSELAFRLQKDINDVIFKYQIESLKHKQ
uniref:MADF domain-containing protein n=1 Tax=Haemonchus contortus TaxID=6289 RepID=A0A7I4YJR7_HAECO